MSKFKFLIFSIALIINCSIFLVANENITASLSKEQAYIGDVIEFTVKVRLPANAQILANQDFKFDDFEIINFAVNHLSNDDNIYELKFDISAYKTGHLSIKPLTVFYINPDGTNNLFFTPEKTIDISSSITDNKNLDIKDIKKLKKIEVNKLTISLVVIISVILIILAVYIIKSIREEIAKSKIVVLDDRTKALNSLNDLYQNRDKLDTRSFYYKMSEILRTYMSQQYKFDAMEMTTSEFFEKAKEFLPKEININEFKNYLKIFNLARYADFRPSKAEIENNYIFTKKLLELI